MCQGSPQVEHEAIPHPHAVKLLGTLKFSIDNKKDFLAQHIINCHRMFRKHRGWRWSPPMEDQRRKHSHTHFKLSTRPLTFPKLPFPSTLMNIKSSIFSLLADTSVTPLLSFKLSFFCRRRVDLETSFCEGRKRGLGSPRLLSRMHSCYCSPWTICTPVVWVF